MSKGMYTVLCYPEDLKKAHKTIKDVVNAIIDSGGECEYILHDKDVFPDGKPKKAHYHINIGYENHFPSWRDFVQFQKDNFLLSPEPKRKTDPPGKKYRKYYEPSARVRDVYAMHRYLTHEYEKEEEAGDVE